MIYKLILMYLFFPHIFTTPYTKLILKYINSHVNISREIDRIQLFKFYCLN